MPKIAAYAVVLTSLATLAACWFAWPEIPPDTPTPVPFDDSFITDLFQHTHDAASAAFEVIILTPSPSSPLLDDIRREEQLAALEAQRAPLITLMQRIAESDADEQECESQLADALEPPANDPGKVRAACAIIMQSRETAP